jgi:hypothetical protein
MKGLPRCRKPENFPKTLGSLYKFYASIPARYWITGDYETSGQAYCALGHLGRVFADDPGDDATHARVRDLGFFEGSLVSANDGGVPFDRFGKTPKTRVLKFLKYLMKRAKQ